MPGSQMNTQRETTPLRRDNARIRSDRAPSSADATRSAFGAPGQQGGGQAPPHPPPGYPATNQQPPVGAPGPGGGPAPSGSPGITPGGWVLRGLGLFAVSLVSGLLWLALGPGGDEEEAAPPEQPPTKHDFQPVHREEAFQGCKAVSTDRIQEFFGDVECEHLTRALYTTALPGGDRALTSVVTVLMPDEESARSLDELTTRDGTGNIRDLVDDGRAGTEDMPPLGDRAYGSERQGRLVVIGDSAYFDQETPAKDPVLLEITRDALNLGQRQDGQ